MARYHLGMPLITLRQDDLTERWLMTAVNQFQTVTRLHAELAALEWLRGRGAAGLARMEAAIRTWPENASLKVMRADLAWLSSAPDLFEITEDLFRQMPEAGPGFWWVNVTARARYARLLVDRGRLEKAAPLIAKAAARANAAVAQGSRACDWIELAGIRVLQGERDGAVEALTRAYDSGARDYGFLEADPMFAPIHSDPRFRAILDRMAQDVAAQRQRAAARGLLDLDGLAKY